MMKRLLVLIVLVFTAAAAHTPTRSQEADMDWSRVVAKTWEGYKRNFIFCGASCGNDSGLVYDPSLGYLAPSEGVGYGLLMAVMMHDQLTFDRIYDAAYAQMLDAETGLLHWRVDNAGTLNGFGSATDAEQDIAAALIFAERRAQSGEWVQPAERSYGERASALIDAIWQYEVVDGRYVKPGDNFGNGQDIVNLSYFSPAWYRLYDTHQQATRWQAVIDQGYESLYATSGAAHGLAPDWSNADGGPATDYCTANGRPLELCSYEMRYDAIRVPWRIGLDCLWFGEPRACEWSARSAAFMRDRESGHFARMYDMDGRTVVTYQDETMIGMWLVAAMAADDAAFQDRVEGLLRSRSANAEANGYFGETSQYYFNQSLAWFGAALLSGDFQLIP